ncbi:MAG: EamA/RhaT family transporter [Ruminococcaceae bacterium]|nr:EamA/RhaT family transporter [Oscillospiraceae bacterium]
MNAKVQMVTAMFIFGTIGIFVRHISLPSSVLACARGFIGTGFLLLVIALGKKKLSRDEIRGNWKVLLFSGAGIGVNWVLLFEAYNYTTVATATLCYYLAPIFIIIATPFVLKEKLTPRKALCVVAALLGMVLVSGVLQGGLPGAEELRGILFGLGAAVLYATVVLANRFLHDISAYTKTVAQLFIAAAVTVPYILLTEDLSAISLTAGQGLLVAFLGIVHTGVAYTLYFSSLGDLKMHTAAIFSYIDPVVAVILSALLLREPMGLWGGVGAVLILGSALVSELPEKTP